MRITFLFLLSNTLYAQPGNPLSPAPIEDYAWILIPLGVLLYYYKKIVQQPTVE